MKGHRLLIITGAAVLLSGFFANGYRAIEEIPSFYDCREDGRGPVIRKQGSLGTCWAISACSALESSLLPERKIVFSPDHLSLNNAFVISQQEGGDPKMIMAYLSGWQGPVPEDADPYGDGLTVDGLGPSVHVQEMRLLDDLGRDQVKRLILENGAVQTSLCMDRKMTRKGKGYYNPAACAYYDPVDEALTHDIIILGWDDAFSKDNFAQIVPADGAWICQNTWGPSFGDNGIFYVSYADANILKTGLAYTKIEDTGNYDHIYQTDPCGWQARIGYDKPEAWFANIYTAQENEILRAVGFYSVGTVSDYEVWIVHDAAGCDSFYKKEMLTEGTLDGSGFFTVRLEEPCKTLTQGERFAILVRIHTEGVKKPVAAEMKKDTFTQNVTLEGKEGFISENGSIWDEAESIYGTNICLKAYTSVQ